MSSLMLARGSIAAALLVAVGAASAARAEAVCGKSAKDIFALASNSVASIQVMAIDPFDPYEKVRFSVGTGFVVDKSGLMLTNYHVLLNASSVNVTFPDGHGYWADLVAADPILDVAEIRPIDEPAASIPLDLADGTAPPVGTSVFAVGHPLGLKTSISTGIVSSTDVVLPISTMSWDEPYIQTDAAINPGNSGGPLLDACGKVVGMNTLGFPKAENIGFAIPAQTLKYAIDQFKSYGRIRRPWIGISGRVVDPFVQDFAHLPFEAGFMIETVEPGSAAEEAGLRGGYLPFKIGLKEYLLGGDIIKSVNGKDITNLGMTAAIVRSLKPGDRIKVEYYRDGDLHKIETTLPERPVLAEDTRVLYRSVYGLQQPDYDH